jgi:hypothetical protein
MEQGECQLQEASLRIHVSSAFFPIISPLAVACRQGHSKIVNVLLEFGANMNPDEFGVTPLHWAANSGKSKIINSLIKKGGLGSDDLQKKDQFGSTPLHFASVRNLNESVQTLVRIKVHFKTFRLHVAAIQIRLITTERNHLN